MGGLILSVFAPGNVSTAPVHTIASITAAAALPGGMLHFGLSNGPESISWMTGSGVPWRYR